jgi:membrane protease YdiL (CAAX protease family)
MPEAACAGCGRALGQAMRFCPGCGQARDAATPAPPRPVRDQRAQAAGLAENLSELKRIGWLFGLLLASSFAGGIAQRWDASPWPSVYVAAFDAVVILVFAALRRERLVFLLRVHHISRERALWLAGASAVFIGVMAGYFWALQQLGMPVYKASAGFAAAGWPLWSMFLLVSVMPALFEELAFRGVIQSTLERVFNSRDAWLIQAALFSVIHLLPMMFPSHFLMGLWFGLLRRYSRSLYPGVLLHAVWNALVLVEELA